MATVGLGDGVGLELAVADDALGVAVALGASEGVVAGVAVGLGPDESGTVGLCVGSGVPVGDGSGTGASSARRFPSSPREIAGATDSPATVKRNATRSPKRALMPYLRRVEEKFAIRLWDDMEAPGRGLYETKEPEPPRGSV